jgi:uncharacterized protein (DUF3084 family)
MECKVKYALLSIALFLMSVAASGADTSPSLPTPPETEQAAPGKPNAAQQLDELVNALAAARAELKVLQKKAAATRDETEKKQIEAEIQSLNSHVEEVLASLEKVATGGATAALAEKQEVTSFDWHKEIEDLFKPLVYELKRLTERPRRIEQLRTQQSLLEGRLAQADDALENSVFLRGEWRPITLASNAC